MMFVGIDLAGKESNETGICVLNDDIVTKIVFKDEEIISHCKGAKVVAVDAPLTSTNKPFRKAERELMKEIGPILPLNTPGMQTLSERALHLQRKIEDKKVIETYPRAVEKVIDLNEKKDRFETEHEFDAYLCALTARKYHKNKVKIYGESPETIAIPKP